MKKSDTAQPCLGYKEMRTLEQGNHQQSEKTAYGMGENIRKPYILQRVNIQNI